ncbi:MAG TPA: dTDP-4-dehydrorhamnose 3,5-epimerase [Thermococcus sp.]|nr:dTDP-4-dehydrorhamnose 3,5-epimerase family protein [Candidatus Baldrarchaeota archaeon]HDH44613.1 dTDP-4-dehydrorhamnose 3,5-epimerase [Thermococcus sp.]
MLPGIVVKSLRRFADERGFFSEIMRVDWKDLLGEDRIVQANFSITYPGVVRAWHRHRRGQTDYFVVLRGAAKICAYDDETSELVEIISTGMNLQVVRIPGHYWHGFKAVGVEPVWLVYFVTRLYDYENPDEERRPWNDPTIIPKSINGRTDDPRVGKPWNWNYPPHK